MRSPLLLSLHGLLAFGGVLCLWGMAACSSEAPPQAPAIAQRDSMPVMMTRGVSKLISDSGVIRYKVIAEEWAVYDKTNPPRQEFLGGVFLERFDEQRNVDMYITADTAFWYDQNLWELRGRVRIDNKAEATTFTTEKLYWDMGRREFYSDCYMHIVKPTEELEGNWFRSNESMTQYEVRQSRGFMPVPHGASATRDSTRKPLQRVGR